MKRFTALGHTLRAQRRERRSKAHTARLDAVRGQCMSKNHSTRFFQSQDKAPPDWYSMTRVSKKFRSFLRSIISLIQGKGFSS